MDRLPALRVRMADLLRLRDEYERAGKRRLVDYIEHLIADAKAEITALETPEVATVQAAASINR